MATNHQMIDRMWANISKGLDTSSIDFIFVKFASSLSVSNENAFYKEDGKITAAYKSQRTLREHYKIICGNNYIPFATTVEYLPGKRPEENQKLLSKAG